MLTGTLAVCNIIIYSLVFLSSLHSCVVLLIFHSRLAAQCHTTDTHTNNNTYSHKRRAPLEEFILYTYSPCPTLQSDSMTVIPEQI